MELLDQVGCQYSVALLAEGMQSHMTLPLSDAQLDDSFVCERLFAAIACVLAALHNTTSSHTHPRGMI